MEYDNWLDRMLDQYYHDISHEPEPARCSKKWEGRAVRTTRTSTFDEGNGDFFVMGVNTKRTFCDEEGAVQHADNLIQNGNSDEFLIVKVVGRVSKAPIPVDYERFEN